MARRHRHALIPDLLRANLAAQQTGTLFITPGHRWENAYTENFNGTFRDECLNGAIFLSVAQAQVLVEQWRRHDIEEQPHSSLGYRTPAEAAARAAAQPSHAEETVSE